MIRKMNVRYDTEQVIRIYLDSGDYYKVFNPIGLKNEIQKIATKRYVWRKNGKIKGFITAGQSECFPEGLYIYEMFVRKKYQRKGIGTALINKLKEKYPTLNLRVRCDNDSAIDFYMENGFEIFGRIEGGKLSMVWNRN